MNKFAKFASIAVILSAVGISYIGYAVKDFPDAFDWEDEDAEDYE
jgi:hypothetical protein